MRFLLVHGGWQGGWCWDGVVGRLEALGHSAWAPTLRGSEAGPTNRAGITLQQMADGVATALVERDWHDVILVGHSGGGPIVELLADRMPERVRRLIFVDALVLLDGECILDLLPQDVAAALKALAAHTPDTTVPVDPDLWKTGFMQDGTPEQIEAVLPRLVAYPFGWLNQPVHLTRFWDQSIPASYIFLRQDHALPNEIYRQMARRLTNPKLVECDGGHEAMLTKPTELADAILMASM